MLLVSPKQLVPPAEDRRVVSVKVAVVEVMESSVDCEEGVPERVPRDIALLVAGEGVLCEDEAAGETVRAKGVAALGTGSCMLYGWLVAWLEMDANSSCCFVSGILQVLKVAFVQGYSELLCFLCCAFSLCP